MENTVHSVGTSLAEDGFALIPLPEETSARLCHHILSHVRSIPGVGTDAGFAEADVVINSLDDDAFIRLVGSMGQRIFSQELGLHLTAWLESDVNRVFKSGRIGPYFVPRSIASQNADLERERLATYWRWVRPHRPDVGAPHADIQFISLLAAEDDALEASFDAVETWKIWWPLWGCDAQNSLRLLPRSHRMDVPFTTVDTRFGRRPSIDAAWMEANQAHFVCPLEVFDGRQGLLFAEKLVHVAPPNESPTSRVSGEIPVVLGDRFLGAED